MSTIKSSNEHLTLNADGSGKDIKFQANGVEKASISSAGAFTSTTIDATKLTGDLPAISGANLTGISGGKILQVKYAYWFPSSNYTISNADELSNLNITMTPTSSSSKLISTVSFGMLTQSSSNNYIEVRYNKDSTAIDGGSYGLGYSNYEGTYMIKNYKPHHYTLVHDASNTSSRTYKVIMNTGGNWMVHNGAGNTHIIMEYEV